VGTSKVKPKGHYQTTSMATFEEASSKKISEVKLACFDNILVVKIVVPSTETFPLNLNQCRINWSHV